MNQRDDLSGIADASRPNAGRMYDYFLGGDHNFEIDRQAAQRVLDISPFMPDFMRLVRWFLGEATRRLCAEGFDKFLDFASGLPTMDHIHEVAPQGTKVIYSDIDPVTAAYAQEIIGENPETRFVQCDAGKPLELLNSGVVDEVFGNDRKVAIGFNGVAWFLPDEKVKNSLQVLYDWAEKGTKLFICDSDAPALTSTGRDMQEIYRSVGQELYLRTLEKGKELIGPWNVLDPGFMLLEEWIEIDKVVSERLKGTWGGQVYGVILGK